MQVPTETLLASQNVMYDYKIEVVHMHSKASEEHLIYDKKQ